MKYIIKKYSEFICFITALICDKLNLNKKNNNIENINFDALNDEEFDF